MQRSMLVLTFVVVNIPVISAICTDGCPNTTDVLSFSETNGDSNDVYVGAGVTICCCANGFIGNISWFRNKTGTFQPFSPNNSRYTFQQSRQALTIRATSTQDRGIYRCMATNTTDNDTFDFTLIVHECDQSENQIQVQEKPEPVVHAGIGDTVTVTCRAYFGCGTEAQRKIWRIYWRKVQNGRGTKLTGNNTYYTVVETSYSNGTVLSSSLVMKALTADNFTSEYTCYIINGFSRHPDHYTVILIRNRRWTPAWTRAVVISVSVMFVVIVLGMALLYLRWRHRVKFWIKTKLHRLPNRYGNVDTDVTVLCSSTNVDFVQRNIVSVLRDFGYSVYFHDEDAVEGRPDAVSLLGGLNRSSHGLMYLSSSEEVENFQDFFMQSAVALHGGSRIVVVHEGSFSQILNGLNSDLRQKLNVVKRIQWPENIDNKRTKKNFWCAVRNCLPVVKPPIEFGEPLQQCG